MTDRKKQQLYTCSVRPIAENCYDDALFCRVILCDKSCFRKMIAQNWTLVPGKGKILDASNLTISWTAVQPFVDALRWLGLRWVNHNPDIGTDPGAWNYHQLKTFIIDLAPTRHDTTVILIAQFFVVSFLVSNPTSNIFTRNHYK